MLVSLEKVPNVMKLCNVEIQSEIGSTFSTVLK